MAERSDASPTGDPLIAQAESEADRRRAARAANLFDIRRLIGGLFVIYGVILVVLGLLFVAWALLRPLADELDEGESEPASARAGDDRDRTGGQGGSGR